MLAVRDIMSEDVLTLDPDTTLRDAMSALSRAGVGGAPVLSGGELVGVVSATDLLAFAADQEPPPEEVRGQSGWGDWPETMEWQEGDDPAASYFVDYWDDAGADAFVRSADKDAPEWDTLDEHTVDEVMSRGAFTLPPDTSVREAARRMLEAEMHRALVADRTGGLLGIVSSEDIVRALAEKGLDEAGG